MSFLLDNANAIDAAIDVLTTCNPNECEMKVLLEFQIRKTKSFPSILLAQ